MPMQCFLSTVYSQLQASKCFLFIYEAVKKSELFIIAYNIPYHLYLQLNHVCFIFCQ